MNAPTAIAYADLAAATDVDLGITDWFAFEQDSVTDFARLTHDAQWIHVDPERAKTGPFGAAVVHGFFTLSLFSQFFYQLLSVPGSGMVVNYGLDSVRFPRPVLVGQRVRAHGQLLHATARGGGIRTTTRLTVEVDEGDKPACVANQMSLFYPAE